MIIADYRSFRADYRRCFADVICQMIAVFCLNMCLKQMCLNNMCLKKNKFRCYISFQNEFHKPLSMAYPKQVSAQRRVLVTCRSRSSCKKVASLSSTIGAQTDNWGRTLRPKQGAKRLFLRLVLLQFSLCVPIALLTDATSATTP